MNNESLFIFFPHFFLEKSLHKLVNIIDETETFVFCLLKEKKTRQNGTHGGK